MPHRKYIQSSCKNYVCISLCSHAYRNMVPCVQVCITLTEKPVRPRSRLVAEPLKQKRKRHENGTLLIHQYTLTQKNLSQYYVWIHSIERSKEIWQLNGTCWAPPNWRKCKIIPFRFQMPSTADWVLCGSTRMSTGMHRFPTSSIPQSSSEVSSPSTQNISVLCIRAKSSWGTWERTRGMNIY